ncbi:MAG TPA: FAD:protein FMN transferase [Burkholderiales bacterium]|nr:FAD:protein FMN transferase [Burkholderiales bacterium]
MKPRAPHLALLFVALIALPRARAAAAEYRASSYVFGTIAEITVVENGAARAQDVVGGIFRDFDRMHRELHAWQPGDLVALNQAIARGERNVRTTAEIAALIRESQRLAAQSRELFNPAIGRLVGLWSFHRDKPGGPVPDAKDIARIIATHPRMGDLSVQGDTVTSSNPAVQLDFGGYAKGYALDRAAEMLHAGGIANALINLGGNIMALGRRGERPWRVGLDSPRSAGLMATIDLDDGEAIGTSGDYRRYYEIDGKRYAHIIDPRTGYPVPGVQSVTVLVPRQEGAGALSDAASKPIFIEGRSGWRDAAARMGVSCAMLVDIDGAVHITRELKARLRFSDPRLVTEVVP